MVARRIIDLSVPVYTGMPHWPTHVDPLVSRVKWIARDGFDMSIIQNMTVHTGTHVDAPLHFISGGKSIDKFPIEKFMGNGIVLDVRMKKSGEEITADDLKPFENRIEKDDIVLLCTGSSQNRGFSKEFLFEWPYVDESAAKFLAGMKIKAIGTDGLSIGGWAENVPSQGPLAKTNPAVTHSLFLEKDILIIEELTNLEAILQLNPDARAEVFFAPIALSGCEAAPCRAYAIVYPKSQAKKS